MAKICKKCGAVLEDGAMFCPNCGGRVEEDVVASSSFGSNDAFGSPSGGFSGSQTSGPAFGSSDPFGSQNQAPVRNSSGIVERNIALCIVFSIITCGIYALYWMIKLNDEVNQIAGEPAATSGGMVVLLTLVTCGIYSWYWCYKMGERVDKINRTDSNKILFIVLAIFGLGIIDYAIMQDTVNKNI